MDPEERVMIRTTINLKNTTYQKLLEIARAKGIEIEEMILALMRYFAKKYKKENTTWEIVRYQERCENTSWECVHVAWYGDEYEFLIDLRKVHKKSVSRLIAEAIMQFDDKLWSYIDSVLDNNQDHRYLIAKFDIHNIIGCLILWDISIPDTPK